MTFLSEGSAHAPDGTAPALHFNGRRILVAEDNPVSRELALRLLQKLGCRADAAANGREALFMHEALNYDMLIMDCQMPELDGYEATRQLRAKEAASCPARRTPVLALTASSDGSEREQCLAAGMDDFIAKPVHAQTLKLILSRWLHRCAPGEAGQAVAGDQLAAVRAAFGHEFAPLAALFLRDSESRLALLKTAVAAGDRNQAARLAHLWGGSCASIGAGAMAALCRDIETRAKTEELGAFAEMLPALEIEYGRIKGLLQDGG